MDTVYQSTLNKPQWQSENMLQIRNQEVGSM